MPNWCDNYIKIKGRSEEIIKCIEGMKGKKDEVQHLKFSKEIDKSKSNKMYYSPKEISEKVRWIIKYFEKFLN